MAMERDWYYRMDLNKLGVIDIMLWVPFGSAAFGFSVDSSVFCALVPTATPLQSCVGFHENCPNSLDLTSSLLLYVCMAMPCVFWSEKPQSSKPVRFHLGTGNRHKTWRTMRRSQGATLPGFVTGNLGTLNPNLVNHIFHDFPWNVPWFSMIFQWWIIHWWIMFPWFFHCFPMNFPIFPMQKVPLTKPWGTSRPGLQRDLHWTMVGLGYVTTYVKLLRKPVMPCMPWDRECWIWHYNINIYIYIYIVYIYIYI